MSLEPPAEAQGRALASLPPWSVALFVCTCLSAVKMETAHPGINLSLWNGNDHCLSVNQLDLFEILFHLEKMTGGICVTSLGIVKICLQSHKNLK